MDIVAGSVIFDEHHAVELMLSSTTTSRFS